MRSPLYTNTNGPTLASANLIRFMSTPVSKHIASQDGTVIYADAIGNPSKPHIVFVHGLSLSGAVFDNVFTDARHHSEFYMVSTAPRYIFCSLCFYSYSRDTICAAMGAPENPRLMKVICRKDTLKTIRLYHRRFT